LELPPVALSGPIVFAAAVRFAALTEAAAAPFLRTLVLLGVAAAVRFAAFGPCLLEPNPPLVVLLVADFVGIKQCV